MMGFLNVLIWMSISIVNHEIERYNHQEKIIWVSSRFFRQTHVWGIRMKFCFWKIEDLSQFSLCVLFKKWRGLSQPTCSICCHKMGQVDRRNTGAMPWLTTGDTKVKLLSHVQWVLDDEAQFSNMLMMNQWLQGITSGKHTKSYWKWSIEIVDLPIKNGDFPVRYVSLPEGNLKKKMDSAIWMSVTHQALLAKEAATKRWRYRPVAAWRCWGVWGQIGWTIPEKSCILKGFTLW